VSYPDAEHREGSAKEKRKDDLAAVHAAPGAAAPTAAAQLDHAAPAVCVLTIAAQEIALCDTMGALVLVVAVKSAVCLADRAKQLMLDFLWLLPNTGLFVVCVQRG
jgi:hypothetical protein